jgi:hypothetical protein
MTEHWFQKNTIRRTTGPVQAKGPEP